jgi:predicted cupin superfamily sugar epimerase
VTSPAAADGRERATTTLICFLLAAGDAPVEEIVLVVRAGLAAGQQAQVLVPAGLWQRNRPGAEDALVSCLVSPGFDFDDFELADGV